MAVFISLEVLFYIFLVLVASFVAFSLYRSVVLWVNRKREPIRERDYLRLLARLKVHIENTKDMINTIPDDDEDMAYYEGKLKGLEEAEATMTSRTRVESRQEKDCPFCHEDYPIAPGVVIKGEHLYVGKLKLWIWYCPICGRRVRKFPGEKRLPE